jgi:hypothetical protein
VQVLNAYYRVLFSAAILCSFAHRKNQKIYRYNGVLIFSTLYLIFAIIFGKRLEEWDYNVPGACYNTHLIAESHASHPFVDRIYLGITCYYMFGILIGAIIFSKDYSLMKKDSSGSRSSHSSSSLNSSARSRSAKKGMG